MLNKKMKFILFSIGTIFLTGLIPMSPVMASESYEVEDNKYFDLSNYVELGTNCSGTLNTDNDLDYYKITIKDNGSFSYSLKVNKDCDLSFGYRITFFNSNQDELYSYGGIEENFYQDNLMLAPGDYYIKVENSTKNYATEASAIYTLSTSFTKIDYCEKEDNSNFKDATSIDLNNSYVGTLYINNDADYYKFTIKEGGSLNYTLKVNKDYDLSFGYKLSLFNSDQDELFSFGGIQENFYQNNLILAPGDYYIKVENSTYNYATDKSAIYTLNTTFTGINNCENEDNNVIKKAMDIKLNTKYTGEILTGDDEDWYQIKIKGNSYINIDMVVDRSYDLGDGYYTEIYNSKGAIIKNSIGGNGYYWVSNELSEKIQLTKGTYYIVLKPYNTRNYPSSEAFYNFKIINKAVVKFDSNGGKAVSSKTYVMDKTLGTLQVAKRSGYTFSGWYTKKNGGTKISTKAKVTGSVTYYAHWVKK